MNAKELFINDRRHEALAALAEAFDAVLAGMTALDEQVTHLKARRGERITDRHPHDDLTQVRERAYEVAFIRVTLAHDGLLALVGKLHEAVQRVRTEIINGDEGTFYSIRPTAKNNVMCAIELADAACVLYHETNQKQLWVTCAGYTFAIDRLYKKVDEVGENPREWIVIGSAWGGSSHQSEVDKVKNNPPPYMTLSEAQAEAGRWVGIADTIGGDAVLYNVRTGEHRLRWY